MELPPTRLSRADSDTSVATVPRSAPPAPLLPPRSSSNQQEFPDPQQDHPCNSRVLAAYLGTDGSYIDHGGGGNAGHEEEEESKEGGGGGDEGDLVGEGGYDSYDEFDGDDLEEGRTPSPPPPPTQMLFVDGEHALQMVYQKPGEGGGMGHFDATKKKKGLGTWPVYLASVETMWGVILFIKFSWCVGTVGLLPCLGAVLLSAACQLLSASSLSAVATNGLLTRSGGAYVMLVKSIGIGAGGAVGIMYYLGMTSVMAVELWGAVDVAESLVRHHYGEGFLGSGIYWDRVLLCLMGFTMLALLRVLTSHHVRHLLSLAALLVFFIAIIACCAGVFAGLGSSWEREAITNDLPQPSLQYLRDNLLLREEVTFRDFARVLVFIYPSFIGIFQGANLCNDIAHPFTSIPLASFASVLTSLGLYSVLLTIMALMAPAPLLITYQELFLEYAYPTYYIGYMGAIAVGICSALSCLEAAPMLLKGVADDRVLRFLNSLDLGKVSAWSGEPERAIVFTILIALPFSFVPDIDVIAAVAAVCFLATYLAMNFVCFLQSTLRLPGWRPHFRLYSWHTALFGTLACAFIMFYIEGVISLAAVIVAVVLFIIIEITGDTTTFGSGIRGLKQHIALTALLGVEEPLVRKATTSTTTTSSSILSTPSLFQRRGRRRRSTTTTTIAEEYTLTITDHQPAAATTTTTAGGGPQQSFWRPQLLVYLHAASHDGACTATNRKQLLSFASQLKATRGLTIVASIHLEEATIEQVPEGTSLASILAADYEKKKAVKKTLTQHCDKAGIVGFVEVVTAPDYRTGLSMLLQLSGLGSLRPNCCVFLWPDMGHITKQRAQRILELLARATAHEKAVIALKLGNRPFPKTTERLASGTTMDVWWLLHDGGILVLISYLLHRHAVWRNCRLRLFTVVEGAQNVAAVRADLVTYLQAVRIKAEVMVVNFEHADLEDFSTDWTVRRRRTEAVATTSAAQGSLRRPSLSEMFEAPTPTTGGATTASSSSSAAAGGVSRGSTTITNNNNHRNGPYGGTSYSPFPPPPSTGASSSAPPPAADASTEFARQVKIRRAIIDHSKDAAIVLINLPPPPKASWNQPLTYFKLVESLTADLARVVFVYGSGTEVLSQYI